MTLVISIHAPRTGSDGTVYPPPRILTFQSTLPARGATGCCSPCRKISSISIHAPRTGSDILRVEREFLSCHFNPRSPHGERLRRPTVLFSTSNFNPRSPHGERRGVNVYQSKRQLISIHAPRTGSDDYLCGLSDNPQDFNPRSPHGERPPGCKESASPRCPFQSTLPARGATATKMTMLWISAISIHAPRTGSDGVD